MYPLLDASYSMLREVVSILLHPKPVWPQEKSRTDDWEEMILFRPHCLKRTNSRSTVLFQGEYT